MLPRWQSSVLLCPSSISLLSLTPPRIAESQLPKCSPWFAFDEGNWLHFLALDIVDRIAIVAQHHASLFAVEDDVESRTKRVVVAAQSFPGDQLLAFEFEADGVRVRRFLIVFVAITAAR